MTDTNNHKLSLQDLEIVLIRCEEMLKLMEHAIWWGVQDLPCTHNHKSVEAIAGCATLASLLYAEIEDVRKRVEISQREEWRRDCGVFTPPKQSS